MTKHTASAKIKHGAKPIITNPTMLAKYNNAIDKLLAGDNDGFCVEWDHFMRDADYDFEQFSAQADSRGVTVSADGMQYSVRH